MKQKYDRCRWVGVFVWCKSYTDVKYKLVQVYSYVFAGMSKVHRLSFHCVGDWV